MKKKILASLLGLSIVFTGCQSSPKAPELREQNFNSQTSFFSKFDE